MKWLFIAFLAGQTLDGTTTAVALHRGCREVNQLIPGRVGPSIAVAVTVGGGSTFVLAKARKKHPRLVMTALGVGAGVRLGAGIYNWQKLADCRR